jgi:hypothetical protein
VGRFSAVGTATVNFGGAGDALKQSGSIALIPGKQYVLSGFIHTGALTGGHTYLDIDDAPGDPNVGVSAPNGVDEWQFVYALFTATESKVSVRLVRDQFFGNRSEVKAGEPVFYDEIAVTPADQFLPPGTTCPSTNIAFSLRGGKYSSISPTRSVLELYALGENTGAEVLYGVAAIESRYGLPSVPLRSWPAMFDFNGILEPISPSRPLGIAVIDPLGRPSPVSTERFASTLFPLWLHRSAAQPDRFPYGALVRLPFYIDRFTEPAPGTVLPLTLRVGYYLDPPSVETGFALKAETRKTHTFRFGTAP